MALTVWGLQTSWIAVSLVGLVVAAPIGPTLVEPRVKTLGILAREAPDGALPPELVARTHDPMLGTGMQTLLTLVFGIVFLMTNKPPLEVSIIVMGGALALGVVSGLPHWLAALSRKRAVVTRSRHS
jgi:hypothetical protein